MTYQKYATPEEKHAFENKTYTLPAKPPFGGAFDFKAYEQAK